MTRLTQNEFDQSTLEAMMDRYRAELLRYQRATPPGRPTLEQNPFQCLTGEVPGILLIGIAVVAERIIAECTNDHLPEGQNRRVRSFLIFSRAITGLGHPVDQIIAAKHFLI